MRFYSPDLDHTFVYVGNKWVEVDNKLNTIKIKKLKNLRAVKDWMRENQLKKGE